MSKCESCENSDVQVILKDGYGEDRNFRLCQNCLLELVNNRLDEDHYFNLLKNGHSNKEFLLHDDYYDEDTGEALQPR